MTTTVWPAAWRCSATPSHSRALDARPWTSTKGAAARFPTRTSTCNSTPGATAMRRSTTFAAEPAGSVVAPILASLARRRGSAASDRISRATSTHGEGADDGGIDRWTGGCAHLDGGRSLPGDGALLPRHARAHAALREGGFHQLRLERRAPERGGARPGSGRQP